IPITRNLALNERDYGDLSGLNKDDARAKWGEEQVLVWRRSYDVPPPGGESLKDTLARTLPYYVQEILPCVLRGQRT
ncbi:histidine phosphatase family protein, partial [Acinetobacter baumannii]